MVPQHVFTPRIWVSVRVLLSGGATPRGAVHYSHEETAPNTPPAPTIRVRPVASKQGVRIVGRENFCGVFTFSEVNYIYYTGCIMYAHNNNYNNTNEPCTERTETT